MEGSMQRIKRQLWNAGCVPVALLLAASTFHLAKAQQTTAPIKGMPTASDPLSGTPSSRNSRSVLNDDASSDAATARMQEQRAHLAQDERHKRMAQDAEKLLALATQLKADVDKATKNETSVSAFQKANEIEKLAHDVKERLRN
jgi:site-specific recombinase